MKLTDISFKPIASVVLTTDEMQVLLKCSERHYDSVCKTASKQGGFLYGMKNYADSDPSEAHHLTLLELDTLAKIAEGGVHLELEAREIAAAIGSTIKRILITIGTEMPAARACVVE